MQAQCELKLGHINPPSNDILFVIWQPYKFGTGVFSYHRIDWAWDCNIIQCIECRKNKDTSNGQ